MFYGSVLRVSDLKIRKLKSVNVAGLYIGYMYGTVNNKYFTMTYVSS